MQWFNDSSLLQTLWRVTSSSICFDFTNSLKLVLVLLLVMESAKWIFYLTANICFHHVRNIIHYCWSILLLPSGGNFEISLESEEYNALIISWGKKTSGTQVAVDHSIHWVCIPQKVQVETHLFLSHLLYDWWTPFTQKP